MWTDVKYTQKQQRQKTTYSKGLENLLEAIAIELLNLGGLSLSVLLIISAQK